MGIEIRTPQETGALLNKKISTLNIWRFKASRLKRAGKPIPPGIALAWIYVNGRVFYRQQDIDAYLGRCAPTMLTRAFAAPRRPSPGRPRKQVKGGKARAAA